jgi:hypothetical protein
MTGAMVFDVGSGLATKGAIGTMPTMNGAGGL